MEIDAFIRERDGRWELVINGKIITFQTHHGAEVIKDFESRDRIVQVLRDNGMDVDGFTDRVQVVGEVVLIPQ